MPDNTAGGAATDAPGVSAPRRGPRLILTNPEMLGTRRARELFEGVAVSHLVIDEAHCVAEWGETFRPAYLELGTAIRTLRPHVVTGFTATASPDILARINTHLFGDAGYHLIRGNPDRPNIRYAVLPVASKSAALRTLLDTDGADAADDPGGPDGADAQTTRAPNPAPAVTTVNVPGRACDRPLYSAEPAAAANARHSSSGVFSPTSAFASTMPGSPERRRRPWRSGFSARRTGC